MKKVQKFQSKYRSFLNFISSGKDCPKICFTQYMGGSQIFFFNTEDSESDLMGHFALFKEPGKGQHG